MYTQVEKVGLLQPIMRGYSQRAMDIQPTGVRKMFDMAGGDVISFGLGEPDFQPPEPGFLASARPQNGSK